MAIMIPDMPRGFNPNSKEGLMFDELNQLSEEYYVFHSFSMLSTKNNVIKESEADFVIFHPNKGILCIEAKAGNVYYENGYWKYGSGRVMSNDGPYNQAKNNKWKIKDQMLNKGMNYEFSRCKLLHAVWFPDIPFSKLRDIDLPAEADLCITLTADSFGKIESEIEKIFDLEIGKNIKTDLSKRDINRILEKILAPSFNLISLQEAKVERTKTVFKRMLREQMALLKYLDEQDNAIINGLAGTGKTVMAIEKAKIHSEKNEKVLFLCYNAFLNDHLRKNYEYPFVDYFTIDGFACKICETEKSDYCQLKNILEQMYFDNNFPYKHVIIDEGQDFGRNEIDEVDIINLIKLNVLREGRNGTFYLFYDKNQMIQSYKTPEYIENADCKLTLYRNCRNTKNIATTSLRLLDSKTFPKLYAGAVDGDHPNMGFATNDEDAVNILNAEINKYIEEGYKDITILTCKTENRSIISNNYRDNKYYYGRRKHVNFTTCRKFKGLESDVIIVIDIDKNIFNEKQGEQLMYVGTSRARYRLTCIVNMTQEECEALMNEREVKFDRNIYKSFATAFNAKIIKNR